ncbi:diguanylate cyclase [Pseudogemmobacter bohemicus]|uniref:diguanylate cyclase n=1 Tax=Pseudogemmobacter bohemicus TaxID=2250708 RepID=UPI000DD2B6B8|nr:diguanylate cyclase [Pseudogemmobacter bohemicus]
MYGLLLRALQDYIQVTFDPESWDRIIAGSGTLPTGFEPLLPYKHEVLRHTLRLCAEELERPVSVILEDLGTWVIAAGYHGAARRLLRFCGADFADFLYSLGELPDRARLALPDLTLPDLSLEERGAGLFRLTCSNGLQELNWILLGALRAMADDYGALVLIEEENCPDGRTIALSIRLLESHFSEGRTFDLARESRRGGRGRRKSRLPAGSTPADLVAAGAEGRPLNGDPVPEHRPADAHDPVGQDIVASGPGRKRSVARSAPGIRDTPALVAAGGVAQTASARNGGGQNGGAKNGVALTGPLLIGPTLTLAMEAFNHLLPLHLILSETGRILAAGSLMRRMFPGEDLIGSPLMAHFLLRVTGQSSGPPLLPLRPGLRVRLQQRVGGLRLRGMTVALERGEGVLMVFSFGIDIVRAVEALNLTDSDFAATDMAMELLCLTEANGLAMEEMRALSRRLDGARRQAEDEALTDPLTGLRNRRACDIFLGRICRDGGPFTVMHLDLDFFKEVNDRHGHAAGDEVLIHMAAVLSRLLRSRDCIARVGGDEFLAIMPGLEPSARLQHLADQLIMQVARPVLWQGAVCRVSVSIGMVAVAAGETPQPAELLAQADKALYAAKASGRSCVRTVPFRAEAEDGAAAVPGTERQAPTPQMIGGEPSG